MLSKSEPLYYTISLSFRQATASIPKILGGQNLLLAATPLKVLGLADR